MGYSAKAIANFFIEHYGKKGISPLKLQKLVYLAHGWHLGLRDEELVNDEFAEAWQYGPVFPSIYHEFKHLGSAHVKKKATELDENFEFSTPSVDEDDSRTIALLNRVWDVYGKHSGLQLSRITHAGGSPWDVAFKKDGARRNAHISDEEIRKYYKRLAEKNERSRKD